MNDVEAIAFFLCARVKYHEKVPNKRTKCKDQVFVYRSMANKMISIPINN